MVYSALNCLNLHFAPSSYRADLGMLWFHDVLGTCGTMSTKPVYWSDYSTKAKLESVNTQTDVVEHTVTEDVDNVDIVQHEHDTKTRRYGRLSPIKHHHHHEIHHVHTSYVDDQSGGGGGRRRRVKSNVVEPAPEPATSRDEVWRHVETRETAGSHGTHTVVAGSVHSAFFFFEFLVLDDCLACGFWVFLA